MKFYLLIYIKRYKLTSEKKSPLFLRISVNGKRVEIALKRTISPDLWDNKRQCVKGRSLEAQSINEQIRVFKRRAHDIYVSFLEKDEFVSAEKLKNLFLGVNTGRKTLVQAFSYHNEKMYAQVGKEYALGTYKRYETCLKLIKEFLSNYLKKDDIYLEDINLQFVTEFDYYLRVNRNCNNNTTVKYLKNFKKIINLSRSLDWLSHDPFLNYKVKLDTVNREILTQHEIELMFDKCFSIKRLEEIKDIFLFCCFTGLAYSDVKKLTQENVFKGIDGNNWIHVHRTKTNVPSRIPILPIARSILEKYESYPQCNINKTLLPVPSNQKFNAYLKEIADCVGINKNLTTHIARHTFATTITLNNKVPIESVSKMLGHRSIKTTEHYSKVLDIKISEDMTELMNKLNTNTNNKTAIYENRTTNITAS
jgi:site-specific recombinase XerD